MIQEQRRWDCQCHPSAALSTYISSSLDHHILCSSELSPTQGSCRALHIISYYFNINSTAYQIIQYTKICTNFSTTQRSKLHAFIRVVVDEHYITTITDNSIWIVEHDHNVQKRRMTFTWTWITCSSIKKACLYKE